MNKLFCGKKYISVSHKLKSLKNNNIPYIYQYNKLIKFINKYETYLATEDTTSLFKMSNMVDSNIFSSFLANIINKSDQNMKIDYYDLQYITGGLNRCIEYNNNRIQAIKKSLDLINNMSNIQHIISDNDTYNLLHKLRNSIDLVEHISNNKTNLRINRINFFDVLEKDADPYTLSEYNLNPIADYIKHMIHTIYVNHFVNNNINDTDKAIIYNYDKKSKDILDSKFSINMNKLSDYMYDEIIKCARTEYDAFFWYKEDLYFFLTSVQDIVINGHNGSSINRYDNALNIFNNYMEKNGAVVRNTHLLNNIDINILIYYLNEEINRLNKLNNIIQDIVDKKKQ